MQPLSCFLLLLIPMLGIGVQIKGRSMPPMEKIPQQGTIKKSPEGSVSTQVMKGGKVGAEDEDDGTVRSTSKGGCGSRFLPNAMSENVTTKCIELVGFRMDMFPPKFQDMEKINYDDKCFSKCYLTELNYLTEADTFDPMRIMDEIKKETPHDKWPARLNATNQCLKRTHDMAADEGGVANSPCKFALVFFVCARDAERRMIC